MKKIVVFFFFFFMVIALFLALGGRREPIAFDNTYYNFLQRIALSTSQYKIEIPNIPQIPHIDNVGFGWTVLNVIINFFNIVINVLNVIVLIFNKIIELITFIVILLKEIITFRDSLVIRNV